MRVLLDTCAILFLSVEAECVRDSTRTLIAEAHSLRGDFHPDPADRLLVATARLRREILLTTDRRLHDYPHVDTRW